MVNNNYHIELINDFRWNEVKELLRSGWNENHIFLQSDTLLKWHYSGYGANKNNAAIGLYNNEELVGFRLLIPIVLSVCEGELKREIQSVSSTVYYLKPEYRGQKLGLQMQLYMMEKYHSYFAIASNLKTSAPMHRKSGAFMLDSMYRYICPLSSEFSNLLLDCNTTFTPVKFDCVPIKPKKLTSDDMAEIWQNATRDLNLTSLARPKEYWDWRYIESPIYKYLFFGGRECGGFIVGRIEKLFNEDKTPKSETVFRILEFVPSSKSTWLGGKDERMLQLLMSVSEWARVQGCVASEFYITTKRFDTLFSDSGYKEINCNESNKHLDCISYFEPCCGSKRLCNVTLFVSGYQGQFDFENSYFTLSDADQDRPNILQ